jgi:sulfur relay (sulfurtransferase) DsrF/TusC family protein
MIYTNNQRPENWVTNIVFYFEYKLKVKLFDKIIYAFKINGIQIEPGRTTHEKTITDFIKCSNIDENTPIFFIDDTYHKKMKNKNVYYLNIKPYIYNLKIHDIISRFNHSDFYLGVGINEDINEKIIINMGKYKLELKNKNEYDLDKIISKQVIYHLLMFFKKK